MQARAQVAAPAAELFRPTDPIGAVEGRDMPGPGGPLLLRVYQPEGNSSHCPCSCTSTAAAGCTGASTRTTASVVPLRRGRRVSSCRSTTALLRSTASRPHSRCLGGDVLGRRERGVPRRRRRQCRGRRRLRRRQPRSRSRRARPRLGTSLGAPAACSIPSPTTTSSARRTMSTLTGTVSPAPRCGGTGTTTLGRTVMSTGSTPGPVLYEHRIWQELRLAASSPSSSIPSATRATSTLRASRSRACASCTRARRG